MNTNDHDDEVDYYYDDNDNENEENDENEEEEFNYGNKEFAVSKVNPKALQGTLVKNDQIDIVYEMQNSDHNSSNILKKIMTQQSS